jgi:serine/threonine protein kinase/type II secretory pathway pseudopilin PulG
MFMADRAGQQLGNYRLLRLLGQGGFADVYLGEHIHLGTQAAIKVLQMRLSQNTIDEFLNEARTIAHLVHPHIIRVLDFGVQEGMPFLVMDYARGGTLRKRFMTAGKPVSTTSLFPYVMQIASALQYAHERKLIHRDIKPENLLIGASGEVLLSDFGLARMTQGLGSRTSKDMSGTAAYMAPEQLRGRPCTASDQYSLGVVVYEWLSGCCPLQGSFFEVTGQHMLVQPVMLSLRMPGIAPEVERVVMRALAKEPQERFSSVIEFAQALFHAHQVNRQTRPMGKKYPSVSLVPETSSQAWSPASAQTSLAGLPPTIAQPLRDVPTSSSLSQTFGNMPSTPIPKRTGTLVRPRITRRLTLSLLEGAAGPSASLQSSTTQMPSVSMLQPYVVLPGSRDPSQPGGLSHSSPSSANRELVQSSILPAVRQKPVSASGIQPSLEQLDKELDALVRSSGFHSQTVKRRSSSNQMFIWLGLILITVLIISSMGVLAIANVNNGKTTNTNLSPVVQGTGAAKNATSTAQSAKGGTSSDGKSTSVGASATATIADPNTNPYPPYEGTLVVNDPLRSNQYNWQEYSEDPITGNSCQFIDGTYHAIALGGGYPGSCFAGSTDFKNFAYQVQMTFLQVGTQFSGGGIVFRGNKDSKLYYYFEIYKSGRYNFSACTGITKADCKNIRGYPQEPASMPSFRTTLGQANTLAVVAHDTRFDLYVNGQHVVGPVINSSFSHGMIGVFATGGLQAGRAQNANIAFSNVMVWRF